MKFTRLEIPDVILIEPKVFRDSRGFFFESYNEKIFSGNGIGVKFVQDNNSRSTKGVLRALHWQVEPKSQDKLVRVTKGEVFDVAVDIRKDSGTFGKYVGVSLSEANKKMLFVPKGFAHGYCVVSDEAEFFYKVSDFYSPKDERGLIWNDPTIQIDWPKLGTDYILSDRDKKHPTLHDIFPEHKRT